MFHYLLNLQSHATYASTEAHPKTMQFIFLKYTGA